MKTEEAIRDAIQRGKVRKAYKPATFRKMKERLKKGELSLGWQIDFLLKHNYTIKHEYNWCKPRVKKGADEHDKPLSWGLDKAFEGADQLPKPCYTCHMPIDKCTCGEKNTTELAAN